MIWRLVGLFLSKPLVTLRLLNMRRIYNGLRVLVTQPGNLGQLYQRYSAIYLSSANNHEGQSRAWSEGADEYIFFPVIDWNFRYQRPQHLASELAKTGGRIFYFSTNPLIADRGLQYVIQETPAENVLVVQLSSGSTRLPDFYLECLTDEEVDGFSTSLNKLIKDFSINSPVAVVQHPFWARVLKNSQWRKVVYDCMDHHAGFFDAVHPALREQEEQLIMRADVVTVSSEKLRKDVSKIKPASVIRNGCEFSRISSAPRRKLKKTTIGYVGAISNWFDVELLCAIAKERPDWDVVLVGSTVGANVLHLKNNQNVLLVGEVEYQEVPDYLASFDVCLIPFKIIPLTEATNPVKLYEYLAAGRPVVATPLPELLGLEEIDVFTGLQQRNLLIS